jgi:asparagine N-glycosylation enzyme membrane subunit Stt3
MDGRLVGLRSWLRDNWAALTMLSVIFALALFLRSFFAYSISQSNGYIVSGGSDSYYWRRIIDYSVATGKQLFWDPMLAYPYGMRNPRPPLYSMSVVVPAVIGQGLFRSLNDSVGFIFIWSTAFWGALTVIPTYLLGKEIFGKRAGLVAAFFLAIMPAHIQRSILTDADHDAIILFFIVLMFYFILKSVKAQQHLKWVEHWSSLGSIGKGLGSFFRESRTAILYSLMAGMAFGCVIMIWVGFAYVAVLVLAYYIVQVLFNKFRGMDSTSVTLLIFISMGFGFLLSYPVYNLGALLPNRFDVPFYIFLAAMFFGIIFVVSRDLPWTIVLPGAAGVVVVGVAVISIFSPGFEQAILSGAGYFVQSKLYSTIAEAKAPVFSELAMSFGTVTFFMSLIGLIWALIKLPKRADAAYMLMAVWLAVAIFMAISAGRFMFNAAPAFAISSAWVLVMIIDHIDFNSVRKSLAGAGGSYWQIFRKSVKIRHIVGVLFLAFLIVMPNVWYGFDAAIPTNTKQSYDQEIYYSFPSFMRPGGYTLNSSQWYLGAFGYQLPLPSYYFPAAWSWFAKQDDNLTPAERPGFVAWWDYGFEAIQEGQHPAVADNFQDGYQTTGNMIMAQSEQDEISMFALELVAVAWSKPTLKPQIEALFVKYGVSMTNMTAILSGPDQPIIDMVLSDPLLYGPMASDLDGTNARIMAGTIELDKMGMDNLVNFYSDVCAVTGWSIGYFMVDSRMFPLSGQSTGIFYAPAKLSDRRIDSATGSPVDFYVIQAQLQSGAVVDINELTSSDVVSQYVISYKSEFFNSMFYRAMVGYQGADIGQANNTIPGWSSGLETYLPMPGWNMTHFKMVYRTVYYNPYPTTQIAQHQDAWTAIDYATGLAYQSEINAGTRVGYVDMSGSSYYRSGTVFLKYYPGAIVNGTLATSQGMPVSNARVTVQDEYGIPHDVVYTDSEGHYSVVAPAGNLTLVFSTGSSTTPSLTGSTTLASVKLNVTEDQGMRVSEDLNRDGIPDFYITENVVIQGSTISGNLFWDMNGDGNYTAGTDVLITGATIYATDNSNQNVYSLNASGGSFSVQLSPGSYTFSAVALGRNITSANVLNVTFGNAATTNLAIRPGSLTGTIYEPDGTPAAGVPLTLTDEPYGYMINETTSSDGSYSFEKLIEGTYTLSTTEPGMAILAQDISVTQGNQTVQDAILSPASTLTYTVLKNGVRMPYATYMISNYYDPTETMTGSADGFGTIVAQVPKGLWTLFATYYDGSARYSGAVLVSTDQVDSVSGTLVLGPATDVSGSLVGSNGAAVAHTYISFETTDGPRICVLTNNYGDFEFFLPQGTYGVTSQNATFTGLLSTSVDIQGSSVSLSFTLAQGLNIGGTLYALNDANAVAASTDAAGFGELKYTDSSGNIFVDRASYNGTYAVVVPSNSQIEFGLGDPGYSQWSLNATFTTSSTGTSIVATPDARLVTGYVTYNGTGLRGVEVTFVSTKKFSESVTTTTGAGGFYSVLVPPSNYSVIVDQATGPAGGQNYQANVSASISPSDVPMSIDLAPVVRLEMTGTISWAGTATQLTFEGPESRTVSAASSSYSVFLLPGTYSIYATSTVGSLAYADISSAYLSLGSTVHNIVLSPSQTISGTVMIGSKAVTQQATITAASSAGPVVHSKSLSTGVYSLPLPQGSYTLTFMIEGVVTEGTQRLYVEYYDQEAVTINSGGLTLNPGLQVRMDNTTFSGTVLLPDGSPTQALVEMTPNTIYGLNLTFLTSPDGTFSENVQPGDYTLYVSRLKDMSVAFTDITFTRNTPLSQNITLANGRAVTGAVTASGVPLELPISVTNGSAKLSLSSGSDGSFRAVLPPATYTLTASTTTVENGLSVSYAGSTKVTVGGDNQYLSFALTRQTTRTVSASWDANLTQSALPGVPVTYVFQLKNTGNIEDTYTFQFTGLTTYFSVVFPDQSVTVGFGANNTANVEVVVTPSTTVKAGTDSLIPIYIRSTVSASSAATLSFKLNVLPLRSVQVTDMGSNGAVSSLTTLSKFNLSNLGNTQDTFQLTLANTESLRSLGWNASIVDAATSAPVERVSLTAFQYALVGVSFTAIRANPDPTASAIVLATSVNDPSASNYTSVAVRLPDVSIAPGDLQITGNDISYSSGTGNEYADIALVAAIAGLTLGMFYLRRKKGLGRKSQTGGGKK